MYIDCVFSGGGVKAYAYVGALESIAEKGLKIKRSAGTSAGAIVSSLIAAEFSVAEIKEILQSLDLTKFRDPPRFFNQIPFSRLYHLYFKLGLYKGNTLEQWIYNLLKEKGIVTFADLKSDCLKIIVSDISLGRLIVLPDDLERVYGLSHDECTIASAVRMSAGFPFYFMPYVLKNKENEKSLIVDGGLLSNFPLWVFNHCHESKLRPVLGLYLHKKESLQKRKKIPNGVRMVQSILETMKSSHDIRYIATAERDNVIYLPSNNIDTLNFNLQEKEKEFLYETGKQKTAEFLKNWPK